MAGVMSRGEKAEIVRRLREDEGLRWIDIADRMGLAKSTVADLYYDPSGALARARKAKNDGQCVDCGAATKNGGARAAPKRCAPCSAEHSRSAESILNHSVMAMGRHRWADEDIFTALRAAARDGVVSTAMYRGAYVSGAMPSLPLIVSRFGRWVDAVHAAGLRPAGRRRERTDSYTSSMCLRAVVFCAAELGRPPSSYEYETWQRARPGMPCSTMVRRLCGGWGAVVQQVSRELEPVAA
jgi:hypothetical protein